MMIYFILLNIKPRPTVSLFWVMDDMDFSTGCIILLLKFHVAK